MLLTFRKKGFTLIELLVVTSIISLLSSIIFASINEARIKAIDQSIVVEMKEFQKAIELYYTDNNTYPGEVGGIYQKVYEYDGGGDGLVADSDSLTFTQLPGLNAYIKKIPELKWRQQYGDYVFQTFRYTKLNGSNNKSKCGDTVLTGKKYVIRFTLRNEVSTLSKFYAWNESSQMAYFSGEYCILG
jgi:prepilin-type N-terminal cleavage/methylation domain-containing protein